ncbi:MAG: hypothetical protein ABR992_19050 [Solirubrobacteraceae bacterium]
MSSSSGRDGRRDARERLDTLGRAAVLVRLQAPARRLKLRYAHVPVDTGGVNVSVRPLDSLKPLVAAWSAGMVRPSA